MRELFLSEFRRFAGLAAVAAGVHLVVQIFLNRTMDFPHMPWQPHLVTAVVYMLCGLALALYQFGTYRQPSRWIWLMHRPLPRLSIFLALGSASFALLSLAVGLPLLLTLLGLDRFTAGVVDARHYVAAIHAVLLAAIAWLAGAYTMLNRSRGSIVILVLPMVMLLHMASGFVMLVPAVLCLGWLALIVYGTFKPYREAPPEDALTLFATAAPLQIGFYFALFWGGSLLFQYGQIFMGIHPLNTNVPPAGGYTEATRAESRDLFRLGLDGSRHPQAGLWHAQVALMESHVIEPDLPQFPVRHQLSNMIPLQWTDSARRITWTFSHDAMRFHGADTRTGKDRGWLGARGIGDTGRFDAPPWPHAGRYLLTQRKAFAFDQDTGVLQAVLELPADERFVAKPRLIGNRVFVLSDRRLRVYARNADDSASAPVMSITEQFSVALPDAAGDLDRVDVAELVDGILLSFTYGRRMYDGMPDPAQTILHVDADGRARFVARRLLAHDFPLLFEHKEWWISPVLHAVLALPDRWLDKGMTAYVDPLRIPRPRPAVFAALVLSLLSGVAACAWLSRTRLGRRQRIAWLASCLLLGPPALLCLMALQRRDAPRHAQRKAAAPMAA